MDDRAELVEALEAAGCAVRGTSVRCAFHGDRSASGSIYTGQNGRWRYRCHACEAKGDAADIIALSTGRPLTDVLRERRHKEHPMQPARPETTPRRFDSLDDLLASLHNVVDVYRYANPDTRAVELAVIRLDPKAFPQASPAPGGGWWMKGLTGVQPIYNRERVRTADVVLVVEGEKDVRALHRAGVVATTAPMGADSITVPVEDDGKPGRADWSMLAGKRVILWADADEPGRRHMQRVERILGRLHPRPILLRVRAEDVGGAKDAAELIEDAEQTSEEAARIAVQRVIENALMIHAAAALHRRVEDAIAGRLVAVPWPWASVGGLTQANMPGAVTLLCGQAGATKSFMLMQSALWWLSEGWRVAIYETEEPADFWLNRALVLVSGCGGVTDPAWIAAHPDRTRAFLAQHARELDAFAAVLHTTPAQGITVGGLAAWIERQAEAGIRIIIADPLAGAIEETDKPWKEAQSFMLRAKRAAAQHGASVILATHPKTQSGGVKRPPDLDGLAGGASYARLASTVLWLEALEPEPVLVIDADGRDRQTTINRRLRVLKARSGRGTGLTIGMSFDSATLRMAEAGVIQHPGKTQPRIVASAGRDRAAGGADE